MEYDEYICPVCFAFQNPKTGKCMICGKKYRQLDCGPLHCHGESPVENYMVKTDNGFITFRASPRINISYTGKYPSATLEFVFEPDEEEDNKTFSMYVSDFN